VVLRPIQGVSRSALLQTLPTLKNPCVILDLGANVDCTARQICEFAEMGTVYAKRVLGIETPRVGLLNIGEEQAKGNEISKRVHRELNAAPHVNFIGNIEPKALYRGESDVVVCDGFVGNVVLKSSEAVAMLITNLIRREARSTWISKFGALMMRGGFARLKQKIDPNEQAGGLLIGIQGLVFILHGASTARGVENAILGAERAIKADINMHIRRGIEELRATEALIADEEIEPALDESREESA
jgi:glycerol-3-phosphate acyltransferase PlsX